MRPTVVIGFAEALSAPEVAWSLVDHDFQVIAFSRKGRRPALRHSRFVRVLEITPPEIDLARAKSDLREVISGLTRTPDLPIALMPLDDFALCLCGRTDFPHQPLLVGPKGDALLLALNKQMQLELAKVAGFSVPPSRFIERGEDIYRDEVVFPVVFKTALAAAESAGRLSRGHGWICADNFELASAISQWAEQGPMLLQQFVPGVGEGIFGLATRGGVLAWSGHRRVRMMNPQGSGSSACMAVSHLDQEVRTAAERFVQSCGWRGLFMIELLRDEAGKLWFIEFNGRPWGSTALARRVGLEYPAWALQHALNPTANLMLPQAKNYYPLCRHLAREILYLLYVMRGSRTKALTSWPSFWTALFQVCRIGRKDCWYNWRRNDPKVFISDFFETLWAQLKKTATRT